MSFMDEIRKIPPVTRTLCGATLAVTLSTMVQLVSPYQILFVKELVLRKFEIWRIPASFFYAGSGLQFIFDGVMLYRNSNGLESVQYSRRSYDYAWQLFLACLSIVALNIPLNSYIHFRPLLVCLTYLSSAIEPNSIVSLFGLVRIPAKYFPYVMVGMDLVMPGGGPRVAAASLTGVITGHAWWLLEHHQRGGSRFGQAPAFLRNFIGTGATEEQTATNVDQRAFGTASAPQGRSLNDGAPRPAPAVSGYNWGSGQRLGSS